MRLRPIIILLSLIVFVVFLAFQLELALPGTPPSVNNTYTPFTQSAPKQIGSYDVLGYTHGAWLYSWSGVASISWFHGFSTLNSLLVIRTCNSCPEITLMFCQKSIALFSL